MLLYWAKQGGCLKEEMVKKSKSIEKIRKNIRNVPLHDFEALVNEFGYIEPGAKHPKAVIGAYTLPYKKENPIKSCYVKELLEIIDSL
jgi:hypothetical protein